MAFSGTTYAQISAGADTVEDLIGDQQGRLKAARAVPSSIVSSMTALGTEYGPIVDAANALLAADPNDIAKQFLQSHISNLLDDFNATLAEAQALDTLLNS